MFRTATGSKFYALMRQRTATFEVDGLDHERRSGWSVIVMGTVEEVRSQSDVRRLDGLDLSHWAPGPKPHWVRIRAWTVSGRRIEPAEPAPTT